MLTRRRLSDESLKNLYIDRVNDISLESVDKEDVNNKLIKARKLKQYAEACIRDLEKLSPLMPETNEEFLEEYRKKAEPHVINRAPFMMHDEDDRAKELATLLLRGSHKGLI